MIKYPQFVRTQSAVTSFSSGPITVGDGGGFFIAVTFTGSNVAGTLSLQCAATPDFARPFTLTGTSTAVTNSTSAYFNLDGQRYPYVRVVWAYTSGTGNITVDATIAQRTSTDVA